MNRIGRSLAIVGSWVAVLLWLGAFFAVFGVSGLLLGPAFVLFYTWVTTIFFHYRYCRQQELLDLMATAAEADMPLVPALGAYLVERPRGSVREFITSLLLFFVFPGYYWIWHRRNSFDQKVGELTHRLEQGEPLDRALRATPGVASKTTVMAAAVGVSSGNLGRSLRGVAARRLDVSWVELLTPFGYPLPTLIITLVMIPTVLGFVIVFVSPRMKAIFANAGMDLPALTQQLLDKAPAAFAYLGVALAALVLVASAAAGSSTVLWYCPGVGYFYRQIARRRVLQSLSVLLEAGKPMPEAIALLIDQTRGTVSRRLAGARIHVEHGEPLADSLFEVGLLTGAMIPLVRSAQRAGHLPWALAELSERLQTRAVRLGQRVLMFVFPGLVVALGATVAFVVLSLFLPIIKMISETSE